MSHKGVTAPIVGTTSLKNLEELIGELISCNTCVAGLIRLSLAAVHIKLSDDETKYLEEPYAPMA